MPNKQNGLFQAAKVATIVGVFIGIGTIIFAMGVQSHKITSNTETNAATIVLVGENTGLIGANTREINATHDEMMLHIMTINAEIAAIKAIQKERGAKNVEN